MAGKTITTTYRPIDCCDQFGWVWFKNDWRLISTMDDGDWAVFHTLDGCEGVDSATLAGSPYLQLTEPKCGPSATLMVTINVEGGVSMTYSTVEPDQDATARRVMEALKLGKDGK